MAAATRSPIAAWGLFIAITAVTVLGALVVLGAWEAWGHPPTWALWAVGIGAILALNRLAHRLGILA